MVRKSKTDIMYSIDKINNRIFHHFTDNDLDAFADYIAKHQDKMSFEVNFSEIGNRLNIYIDYTKFVDSDDEISDYYNYDGDSYLGKIVYDFIIKNYEIY